MKINDRVPAAKKLHGWMTLKGLTVELAADQFGVTRQTFYRWIDGGAPKWEQIVAISKETGIPTSDWMKR